MATATSTRPATRFWRLFPALIALTLALGGMTGIAPRPAAAQATQNDTEQITQREFDRLTRAAQKNEVVYGPESGTLPLDEQAVAFQSTDVDVENFLVHVEFTNPYAAAEGQWDYGIQFRSQNKDNFLRLIVLSDGSWGLTEGLQNVPASGAVDSINDGAGDTNVIDLYVEGDIGHFGINDAYVASVDLPVSGAGNITVGSGFLADSFQAGAETEFAELIVWTLDDGSLGPNDSTPTTEPGNDRTATAEARSERRTATAEARSERRTATAEAETNGNLSDDDLTATAEAEDQDATATAEADRGNNDEPTYTSPTFGYTLSYGDPWKLSDDTSDDTGDTLVLDSPNASLQFFGTESRDDTSECLDAIIANLEGNPDVSDVAVAQDDRNRDLRDDSAELSWVVVFATFANQNGDATDITAYYECRVIVEGKSLLTVSHIALSDDYNDEIENRTAVLDTIELDGGSPTSTPSRRRTPTAEADQPTQEATAESTDEPTAEATSDVPEGSVAVFLDAVGDSNVTGFGLIEPSGNDKSLVRLLAFGGSGFVTINGGSCRNPDETPAFEVGQLDTAGNIEAEVDAPVEDLTNGDYVMILSDDGSVDGALACGDLSDLAGG